MNRTKIDWCDYTWNPIVGCSPVSEACERCYAERLSRRFGWGWGKPVPRDDRLEEPLRTRRPSRVFVCSMSDMFHDQLTWPEIASVANVMEEADWHTYLLLTKRPERMREFCARWWAGIPPARHVWLGVSAENQARADERIPALLDTPAAVRFVSLEPLLGLVDLSAYLRPQMYAGEPLPYRKGTLLPPGHPEHYHPARIRPSLDWVIVGAQSGPGAVKPDPAWITDIIDQCARAGVPAFLKRNLGWSERREEYPSP